LGAAAAAAFGAEAGASPAEAAASFGWRDGVVPGGLRSVGRDGVNAGDGGLTVLPSGPRNGTTRFGTDEVTPVESRLRICGVIITTSSVEFF
jgi:hypothetical protein